MLKKLFRIAFTFVGVVFGYGTSLLLEFLFKISSVYPNFSLSETQSFGFAVACAFIFGLIFFRATPMLGRQSVKVAKDIEHDLQSVPANDIAVGTFGLIIGLIIAFLVSQVFVTIEIFYLGTILTIITYLILGYLGVIIATKKGGDIIPNLLSVRKGSSSGKGKGKTNEASSKILDTSVIIDGRIADIMKTGFIEGAIVIPEFVLVELRHIADSSDALKRNRGRRGLDILNKIQNDYGVEIYNTNGEK